MEMRIGENGQLQMNDLAKRKKKVMNSKRMSMGLMSVPMWICLWMWMTVFTAVINVLWRWRLLRLSR